MGSYAKAAAPVLATAGVALRTLVPDDLPYLYGLCTEADVGFRWRHRGTTPSPAEFEEALFAGVFAQFVLTRPRREEPLGLVTSYGAHPRDGHIRIGVVSSPRVHGTTLPMVAMGLFIDYLFAVGGFRKMYFEATEFNLAQYGRGVDDLFEREGILRAHEYYGGRYWDTHIFAIYQQDWPRRRERFATLLDRRSPAGTCQPSGPFS